MNADDLRGLDGRKVSRIGDRYHATIAGNEILAIAHDLHGRTIEQDPSVFGHAETLRVVQPDSGRSNQT